MEDGRISSQAERAYTRRKNYDREFEKVGGSLIAGSIILRRPCDRSRIISPIEKSEHETEEHEQPLKDQGNWHNIATTVGSAFLNRLPKDNECIANSTAYPTRLRLSGTREFVEQIKNDICTDTAEHDGNSEISHSEVFVEEEYIIQSTGEEQQSNDANQEASSCVDDISDTRRVLKEDKALISKPSFLSDAFYKRLNSYLGRSVCLEGAELVHQEEVKVTETTHSFEVDISSNASAEDTVQRDLTKSVFNPTDEYKAEEIVRERLDNPSSLKLMRNDIEELLETFTIDIEKSILNTVVESQVEAVETDEVQELSPHDAAIEHADFGAETIRDSEDISIILAEEPETLTLNPICDSLNEQPTEIEVSPVPLVEEPEENMLCAPQSSPTQELPQSPELPEKFIYESKGEQEEIAVSPLNIEKQIVLEEKQFSPLDSLNVCSSPCNDIITNRLSHPPSTSDGLFVSDYLKLLKESHLIDVDNITIQSNYSREELSELRCLRAELMAAQAEAQKREYGDRFVRFYEQKVAALAKATSEILTGEVVETRDSFSSEVSSMSTKSLKSHRSRFLM